MANLSNGKNNSSSSELFKAQAHIWNHVLNFVNSMCLKCAVDLGIADVIHSHGKPITITELTSALSLHPTKAHFLPRLMRLLIHSGFFALAKTNTQNDDGQGEEEEEEEEEEGYVLTSASQLLVEDNPLSLKPFLAAIRDPNLMKPWFFVGPWFRNDDPTTFETAHGMSLWEYMVHDPESSNFFNEAMASDSRLLSCILIDEGKEVFEGLNSLVDVGGGIGTTTKAIAEAYPHIQCTLLDLPHVVDGLHDTPNLKFVGGNMFEEVPPADAILLKWVLHDWSDEKCLKILEKCKKAINGRKGGKVIIIDMVRGIRKEDNGVTETENLCDIWTMVSINGKERNEKEWGKLFSDAGFSDYKITLSLGLRSIIEVYP
ncbi:O-methyltransferase family protein [Euphorbia peplus]|nr:O-methyltransferase family protein [Euphorbia peplus]